MLIVLAIFITAILIVAYYVNRKALSCPAILYISPFLIMTIVAIGMRKLWDFHIDDVTVWVITIGLLSFYLGTFFSNKVRIKIRRGIKKIQINPIDGFDIWKGILLLIINIVTVMWKLKLIRSFSVNHGGGSTFSAALGYYNYIKKIETGITITFPKILDYMLQLIDAVGFIWACLFAHVIVYGNRRKGVKEIVVLNFFLSIIGGLSSGGRGAAIKYLIAFIIAFVFLYNQKTGWKNRIPVKYMLGIFALGVITCILFLYVATFIGRNEIVNVQRYITNYIGAQLYNLNYHITSNIPKSEIFGQETFYYLNKTIAHWVGNEEWSNYALDLPSVYSRYGSLGNVCTTFYAYLHDFGYIGIVVLPFISGWISQTIYRKAKIDACTTEQTFCLSLVVYSYVAYMLVFSFFSNKFYELFVSISMLKMLFWTLVVSYFLFGIKIKVANK